MQAEEAATATWVEVLQVLNTSLDGLTYAEVSNRTTKYGPNVATHDQQHQWYIQLLHSFQNPFIYVLFVLAVISSLTDDVVGITCFHPLRGWTFSCGHHYRNVGSFISLSVSTH